MLVPGRSWEPFTHVEPGAISPNKQNGYEGPTSWFSNISNLASGHVNFSPPVEPGQSTYFSLEEPPTANALIVGGRIQPYVPPPVLGKFFDVSVVSGIVYVKLPSRYLRPAGDLNAGDDPLATDAIVKGQGFVPLTEARQLPAGTVVDARLGKIKLVAATGHGSKTEFGDFSGGIFGLSQDKRGRLTKGMTTLSLVENAFRGAPSFRACRAGGAADARPGSPCGFEQDPPDASRQGARPLPDPWPLQRRHRARHRLGRAGSLRWDADSRDPGSRDGH